MKNQIHLYGEGQPTPIVIDLHENATALELIVIAQKAGALPAGIEAKEFLAFVVDVEEPVAHDHRVHDPKGGAHRPPIHCHRCHKIEITVTFNLAKHARFFAPSTHVSRILQWAIHEFGLTGPDTANKELRLGSTTGQILQDKAPIGSYVGHPHCSALLYLTDIVQVQG
jgi:hypothetical protein